MFYSFGAQGGHAVHNNLHTAGVGIFVGGVVFFEMIRWRRHQFYTNWRKYTCCLNHSVVILHPPIHSWFYAYVPTWNLYFQEFGISDIRILDHSSIKVWPSSCAWFIRLVSILRFVKIGCLFSSVSNMCSPSYSDILVGKYQHLWYCWWK